MHEQTGLGVLQAAVFGGESMAAVDAEHDEKGDPGFFGGKIFDGGSGITGAQSEYQPLLHLGGQWRIVMQYELCTTLSYASLWVNVETTSAVQDTALDQHFIFGLKCVPDGSGVRRST
jgi:hypothetical protein